VSAFSSDDLIVALDLTGIFVFALTGGLLAVRKNLDIFGVLVLASVTGLGGGVIRDVLIGAIPPASIEDWRYLAVPIVAGLLVFRFPPLLDRLEHPITTLDAAGLALFCTAGALKASDYGLGILAAAILGMITAIGGGVLRDVMTGRVPVVLRAEIYALPALAGAAIAIGLSEAGVNDGVAATGAFLVCFGWRMLAVRRQWNAPKPYTSAST
jgi:uncharacterized membrane protein YeiH